MARTTRTRKSDIVTPELAEEVAETQPTSTPAPRKAPKPSPAISHDDLAAIAQMSPEEMAALMDGASVSVMAKLGDQVTGIISRISGLAAFVELGAKSEAQLSIEEVPDAQVGDEITAFVVEASDGYLYLSKQLSGGAADAFLDEAQASGIPVEGKVTGRNRGGFEVRVGSVRAFCPISQMGRIVDDDPAAYLGEVMTFRVLETGDKTVLSRRAILEEGLEERVAEFWQKIQVDDTFSGIVSSVATFGVFVDLGGVDGLIPKREVSWDPNENLKRGQKIEVRVLELNHEARKITLSAKDPGDSPWLTQIGSEFVEGQTYTGTVVGIETFGIFVQLAPGLQGLLHNSRISGDKPANGATIEVKLLEIDVERQRLALAAANWEGAVDTAPSVNTETSVSGVIKEVLHNGVLIDLEGGQTGWLPARNVQLAAGTVLAQRFRRGRKIEARVAEVDAARNRMTLTQLGTQGDGDRAWKKHKRETKSASFGTMAGLLGSWKK